MVQVWNSGTIQIDTPTGDEHVGVDNGGAVNVFLTSQQIADLATGGLPISAVATQAITVGTTLQVAGLTAAQTSNLVLTSATAQAVNLAFPPASEVIAALPEQAQQVGFTYLARILNSFTTTSIGTITASGGVTLVGTATIAQNASGSFNVAITGLSPAAITVTRVG